MTEPVLVGNGVCPTCEGTGLVEVGPPCGWSGRWDTTDCPDCMDPALPSPPEPTDDLCGFCGMRPARAGLTACDGCA